MEYSRDTAIKPQHVTVAADVRSTSITVNNVTIMSAEEYDHVGSGFNKALVVPIEDLKKKIDAICSDIETSIAEGRTIFYGIVHKITEAGLADKRPCKIRIPRDIAYRMQMYLYHDRHFRIIDDYEYNVHMGENKLFGIVYELAEEGDDVSFEFDRLHDHE